MRAEAAKRLHCTSLDFVGSEAASLLGKKLRGGGNVVGYFITELYETWICMVHYQ